MFYILFYQWKINHCNNVLQTLLSISMGMLHDVDRGCTSPNVGVMGGVGVGWSTCSKNDMETMLQ